jgi:uncharacterized protein
MTATLHSIYRYPVKGLSGESLDTVAVEPDRRLPFDRAYAIAHGTTAFDPENPQHLRKTYFVALMTHPRLAELQTRFDVATARLEIRRGETVVEGRLSDPADRSRVEAWLAAFIGDEGKGRLKIVDAPGHAFTDIGDAYLSIQNLASIRRFGADVGLALDPLRFRANLYLEGLPEFAERDWSAGTILRIGAATLRVDRPTIRCAAINVDPATAVVDSNLPISLRQLYGAATMGLYAAVIEGAELRPGDAVTIEPAV